MLGSRFCQVPCAEAATEACSTGVRIGDTGGGYDRPFRPIRSTAVWPPRPVEVIGELAVPRLSAMFAAAFALALLQPEVCVWNS